MENIIFLDIDGVLNTGNDKDINNFVSKKRLSVLEKLLKRVNGIIVIISTRRIDSDFKNEAIEVFYPIQISLLPIIENQTAKDIDHYVKKNKMNSFVIIDDTDWGYSLEEGLEKHFLKIDNKSGLCRRHIKQITKYLNQ